MSKKLDPVTEAELSPDVSASLKELCVTEAMKVIRDHGLDSLSLRKVARELGVSHQAPYKHFPSRDHLLAEVIRRCLRKFADVLWQSDKKEPNNLLSPKEAMWNLGHSYLNYAQNYPLEYKLMFSTPWPKVAEELRLDVDARSAFDVVVDRLSKVRQYINKDDLEDDAIFVWSSIHGLASVMESESMRYLGLSKDRQLHSIRRAMEKVASVTFERVNEHN